MLLATDALVDKSDICDVASNRSSGKPIIRPTSNLPAKVGAVTDVSLFLPNPVHLGFRCGLTKIPCLVSPSVDKVLTRSSIVVRVG